MFFCQQTVCVRYLFFWWAYCISVCWCLCVYWRICIPFGCVIGFVQTICMHKLFCVCARITKFIDSIKISHMFSLFHIIDLEFPIRFLHAVEQASKQTKRAMKMCAHACTNVYTYAYGIPRIRLTILLKIIIQHYQIGECDTQTGQWQYSPISIVASTQFNQNIPKKKFVEEKIIVVKSIKWRMNGGDNLSQ